MTGFAKQSRAAYDAPDCFVALLLAMTNLTQPQFIGLEQPILKTPLPKICKKAYCSQSWNFRAWPRQRRFESCREPPVKSDGRSLSAPETTSTKRNESDQRQTKI